MVETKKTQFLEKLLEEKSNRIISLEAEKAKLKDENEYLKLVNDTLQESIDSMVGEIENERGRYRVIIAMVQSLRLKYETKLREFDEQVKEYKRRMNSLLKEFE